jgi:hypothetical protein
MRIRIHALPSDFNSISIRVDIRVVRRTHVLIGRHIVSLATRMKPAATSSTLSLSDLPALIWLAS